MHESEVKVKSLSRILLFATLWTAAFQAPLSMGFSKARVLEWGAIAFFDIYIYAAAAKSLQLCPTLCDPMGSSPPGSSVPGILQEEYWSGLPFPSPGYIYIHTHKWETRYKLIMLNNHNTKTDLQIEVKVPNQKVQIDKFNVAICIVLKLHCR